MLILSAAILFTACKNSICPKPTIDSTAIKSEVTEREKKLFSLTKDGKMNEAFALHSNTESYRNIVNGNERTHEQMDSVFKNWADKKVKSVGYEVAKRDFLIIDNTNVLETIEATRTLTSTSDSILEKSHVVMSLLWSKDSANWKLAYLHSSYMEIKSLPQIISNIRDSKEFKEAEKSGDIKIARQAMNYVVDKSGLMDFFNSTDDLTKHLVADYVNSLNNIKDSINADKPSQHSLQLETHNLLNSLKSFKVNGKVDATLVKQLDELTGLITRIITSIKFTSL